MSNQSTRQPGSDSFIGRLFKRIKPGTSYAAFPWRSWDKVCTILETIRGRGCKIRRSQNDIEWEIDVTGDGALNNPHAYSVFVLDPSEEVDSLPAVMANADLDALTAFCYVPCPASNTNVIAGANGQNGGGEIGGTASDEYPEGSHWGWISVGEVNLRKTMVVYGILSPGANLVSPKFDSISIAEEADFLEEVQANEPNNIVVPIAWVSGTNVVQALCGRPWDVSRPPLPFDVRAVFGNDGTVESLKMYLPSAPPSYVWLDGSPLSPNGQQLGGWVDVQTSSYYYLALHKNEDGDPDGWKIHATNAADSVPSWAADGVPMVLLASYNMTDGLNQYRHGSIVFNSAGDVVLDTDAQSGDPPGESLNRFVAPEPQPGETPPPDGDGQIQLRQFHDTTDVETVQAIGDTGDAATPANLQTLFRLTGHGTATERPKLVYVGAEDGPFWVRGGDDSMNFGTAIKLGDPQIGYIIISVTQ